MKTRAQAETLAEALMRIGRQAGVPTTAVLTEMNEPLGRTVGNALEVREAWETLADPAASDTNFLKLCIELASHGLEATGNCSSLSDGEKVAASLLKSGKALNKFEEIVTAQGGDLSRLPIATHKAEVYPTSAGTLSEIWADEIGKLAMTMGAGRQTKQDAIDPGTGIVFHSKAGSQVSTKTPLATLHLREVDSNRVEEFTKAFLAACQISTPE